MTLTGTQRLNARSTVIGDGLYIHDAHDVKIEGIKITGGKKAVVYLLRCKRVVISGCLVTKPSGQPDASRNGPHILLLNDCEDCTIAKCHIVHTPNSEMSLGFYKSRSCNSVANAFGGTWNTSRESADCITFDDGSDRCSSIDDNFDLTRGGFSAVVAACGSHTLIKGAGGIKGSHLDNPIACKRAYGKPVALAIHGYPRELVFCGKGAVVTYPN